MTSDRKPGIGAGFEDFAVGACGGSESAAVGSPTASARIARWRIDAIDEMAVFDRFDEGGYG